MNDKLPSENELAEKFDVSRVTVRRALQTLEADNIIYRCQGLGSFVGDKRSHQPLVKLTDFSEDMNRAGLKASLKVLKWVQVPVPDFVGKRLNLDGAGKVVRIDRLRLGNAEPMAFDITWLPLFFGRLLADYDLEEKTIYRILEEENEIPVVRGCYQIQAENASTYLAEQLKVRQGTALLVIDRQSFTLKDKPVYYQRRYYRSDKVVYELLLERGQSEAVEELPLRELSPVFKQGTSD